jgi:hypothetical protein
LSQIHFQKRSFSVEFSDKGKIYNLELEIEEVGDVTKNCEIEDVASDLRKENRVKR